jgi:DTW domain-containing protein YfiP
MAELDAGAARSIKRSRPMCSACARPQHVCLCEAFQAIPAACAQLSGTVVILQHPSERKCASGCTPGSICLTHLMHNTLSVNE